MYGYDDCDCREVYDASGIRKTKKVMEALELLDAAPGTQWYIVKYPKKDFDFADLGMKVSDFGKDVLVAEPSTPTDIIFYNPVRKKWYDVYGDVAY